MIRREPYLDGIVKIWKVGKPFFDLVDELTGETVGSFSITDSPSYVNGCVLIYLRKLGRSP